MKSFRSATAAALHRKKLLDGDLSAHALAALRDEMAACVEERGGDVATRARASALGARYAALSTLGRRRFLELLAEFDVSRADVDAAVTALQAASEEADRGRAERALRTALRPKRLRVLRAFNSRPDGVKFLVEMRADLLAMTADAPHLEPLEADLRELLTSWFDVGFLEMRRITWDAPASLLEKLGRYEAVHEVRGWADLKNRLDVDRRCFAFLHPAMPDEPLIFIEVSLTDGMSGAMASLLDARAPVTDAFHATHAVFYSISNCQRGLDGISFGNALIKRVVQELSKEFRQLRTFVTLSPIPLFRDWLEARGGSDEPLRALFVDRAWSRDAEAATALRQPLMELCAHYLLDAKRGKRAFDPVAHFHLTNGARLERINWLADRSSRGIRSSGGMMVNYLYQLDKIDENQAAYAADGRIAVSSSVTALLAARPRSSTPG